MRDPILIKAKVDEFKQGELPDGSPIGYYKSWPYSQFKRTLNPLARGMVDLILYGGFTGQLFVDDVRPSLFRFDSRDDKSGLLETKYGKDIWGLSERRWDERQKAYSEDLAKWLKQYLKL